MPESISSISGYGYSLPGFDPYSREGREQAQRAAGLANPQDGSSARVSPQGAERGTAASKDKNKPGQDGLTEEQRKQVEELRQTDQRVRSHEQAHVAAGGSLVRGAINFQYTRGPDGKIYATGGDVSIDTSPVKDDPQATITKAGRIRAAAMAPADPSPQDRNVAASADQMAANARNEMARQNTAGKTGETEGPQGAEKQPGETGKTGEPPLPGSGKTGESPIPGAPAQGNERPRGAGFSQQPGLAAIASYTNQAGFSPNSQFPAVFDIRR